MEMRCPVCKADRLQTVQCRRCKADLTMLFTIETEREACLQRTRIALHQGRWEEAENEANRARQLRHDSEPIRLLALAALMRGEFDRALQLHQQIVDESTC